jgi:hypothetical protein
VPNNKSGEQRNPSRAEAEAASDLRAHLNGVVVGPEFKVGQTADLRASLERYIPQLLSHHYSTWEWESLDGFHFSSVMKVGPATAEFSGPCILISDQTVTPFFIRLTIAESDNSVTSYQVLLGEPGGGHLGISGPPCNSLRAQKVLAKLPSKLNDIRWQYRVTSEQD